MSDHKCLRSQSPLSFSPPPLPYLLECCFTSWLRWEETNDWLGSLAVIGCLCMEAILGDNRFFNTLIGSVLSCVYKIFGVTLHPGLSLLFVVGVTFPHFSLAAIPKEIAITVKLSQSK